MRLLISHPQIPEDKGEGLLQRTGFFVIPSEMSSCIGSSPVCRIVLIPHVNSRLYPLLFSFFLNDTDIDRLPDPLVA
jgi:hypothetical protein